MKPMSRNSRRYMVRVGVAMAVYVASLYAANNLIGDAPKAVDFLLAVIPGLATAGLFWAVAMFILETKDEFMRMLLVRMQLIAMGFAMSVFCVWGYLQEFGLAPNLEGHVAIIVLWAVGQLVGTVSNRITHGTWGECW